MAKFITVHNEEGIAVRINTDHVISYFASSNPNGVCKSIIEYVTGADDILPVTETAGEIDRMVMR